MLPTDPRAFLGRDAVSYSEIGTLARCEQAWKYGYDSDTERSPASKAMALGTELHRLWGHYHLDPDSPRHLDTEDDTARWLMERYVQYYDRLPMVAVEQPVILKLAGGPNFFGFADGLFEDDGAVEFESAAPGELWAAELKTTGNLSNVAHMLQSLQTKLYVAALRDMGFPVVGVMLDVIRTFRPVKKELPLPESFQRHWLRWSDEEIDGALDEVASALTSRIALQSGRRPLRNIGPSCSWCSHMAPCFGLELDILDEDDPDVAR